MKPPDQVQSMRFFRLSVLKPLTIKGFEGMHCLKLTSSRIADGPHE